MMLYIPNTKALGLVVSDNIFFNVFPIEAHVKHVTPGQVLFIPQWHNLNKLDRYPLDDVTYQISRLSN